MQSPAQTSARTTSNWVNSCLTFDLRRAARLEHCLNRDKDLNFLLTLTLILSALHFSYSFSPQQEDHFGVFYPC